MGGNNIHKQLSSLIDVIKSKDLTTWACLFTLTELLTYTGLPFFVTFGQLPSYLHERTRFCFLAFLGVMGVMAIFAAIGALYSLAALQLPNVALKLLSCICWPCLFAFCVLFEHMEQVLMTLLLAVYLTVSTPVQMMHMRKCERPFLQIIQPIQSPPPVDFPRYVTCDRMAQNNVHIPFKKNHNAHLVEIELS